MAGFRKAKAEKAALKFGIYGLAGSGKTFTALLIAEGLAKHSGKRIAYIDTERGTDFYANAVPSRQKHPEAFDFDALYTRSITDVLTELKKLNDKEYGVIVLDSITHIWEAAINAYSGKTTTAGTIPFHAWGKIKKPYKELMTFLLNTPMHVLICGRQGNEWATDEETDELKRVGTKMKAEGETPHEPDFLIHMEAVKTSKAKQATITAYAEKDRSGILAGKVIEWPDFDKIAKPLLGLLGHKQAVIASQDETTAHDAEVIAEQDSQRLASSKKLLEKFKARFALCPDQKSLKLIGKEITADLKRNMTTSDVADMRDAYLAAEKYLPAESPESVQEADNDKPDLNDSPVDENAATGTLDSNNGKEPQVSVSSDQVEEIINLANVKKFPIASLLDKYGISAIEEMDIKTANLAMDYLASL